LRFICGIGSIKRGEREGRTRARVVLDVGYFAKAEKVTIESSLYSSILEIEPPTFFIWLVGFHSSTELSVA